MWIKYRSGGALNSLKYIKANKVYSTDYSNTVTNQPLYALCCNNDIMLEVFEDYEVLLKELERFEEYILHGEKLFTTMEVLKEED